MRIWSKDCFGSIKLRKMALLHELELLDIAKESRLLNPEESQIELGLRENLGEIRKQEELYWKQRSRSRWLQEGDENTKYFHAITNGRKNSNYIPSIKIGEDFITDIRGIGKVFENHFRALFGQKSPFRFKVDLQKLLRGKNRVDLSPLSGRSLLRRLKKRFSNLEATKLQILMVFLCCFLKPIGRSSKLRFGKCEKISILGR